MVEEKGRSNEDDSKKLLPDPADVDEQEQQELLNHGLAFREFVEEARDIEAQFCEREKKTLDVIRAADAALHRALECATRKVDGFRYGATPLPWQLTFAGLIDVQAGHYSRVLSPNRRKFGVTNKDFHRQRVIGHAIALWDILKEYELLPSGKARDSIIAVLNDANFRVQTKTHDAIDKPGLGKVTEDTIEKWLNRATNDDAPYASEYKLAGKALRSFLETFPVKDYPDLAAERIIDGFRTYAMDFRVDT